jgi:hypothetical protein
LKPKQQIYKREPLHLADRFTYLTAVASGKVANVDLAKEAMPEDAKAKIPDPRELRIRLRR